MPTPDDLSQWGGVWRELGGWGTAIVFLWLYVSEIRAGRNKDAKLFGYLEQANDTFKEIANIGGGADKKSDLTPAALPPKDGGKPQ